MEIQKRNNIFFKQLNIFTERRLTSVTFEEHVQNAINTIIDLCIYQEGNCQNCPAKELCRCSKPMELVNKN